MVRASGLEIDHVLKPMSVLEIMFKIKFALELNVQRKDSADHIMTLITARLMEIPSVLWATVSIF